MRGLGFGRGSFSRRTVPQRRPALGLRRGISGRSLGCFGGRRTPMPPKGRRHLGRSFLAGTDQRTRSRRGLHKGMKLLASFAMGSKTRDCGIPSPAKQASRHNRESLGCALCRGIRGFLAQDCSSGCSPGILDCIPDSPRCRISACLGGMVDNADDIGQRGQMLSEPREFLSDCHKLRICEQFRGSHAGVDSIAQERVDGGIERLRGGGQISNRDMHHPPSPRW